MGVRVGVGGKGVGDKGVGDKGVRVAGVAGEGDGGSEEGEIAGDGDGAIIRIVGGGFWAPDEPHPTIKAPITNTINCRNRVSTWGIVTATIPLSPGNIRPNASTRDLRFATPGSVDISS